MIFKTYFDKVNTIIENSELNVGISPIAKLTYGTDVSRILLHFDEEKLSQLKSEKYLSDLTKCKHYLNITNSGKLDEDGYLSVKHINNVTSTEYLSRAASFDLIFFAIPMDWDGGNGYDFKEGVNGESLISTNGATWNRCRNGAFWNEAGVYCNGTLSLEYDKFSSPEGSGIIIARQHFNTGNENIRVDITSFINAILNEEIPNYGIGVAFSPVLEASPLETPKYISFFTHKTNTFFEPYIETIQTDTIVDDRNNFFLDKNNKLYLYCNIGQKLDNLDELPVCKINNIAYPVKQASKGIYYIEINLSSRDYKAKTMLYDIWSNIKYNGVEMDDVELDFVLKPQSMFFNMGSSIINGEKYIPELYGIKDYEVIQRGDIRKLNFIARIPYTKEKFALVDNMEIRIYVKDGDNEFDVISYDKIDRSFSENFYLIDTSTLLPHDYFVDIKVKVDQQEIIHHNILKFKIVNNLTEKYK